MTAQSDPRLFNALKVISRVAGIIVALVGCAVLIGWKFDIQILKSILPSWVAMKPNTAFCFVLSGLSLNLLHWQRRKNDQIALGLALLVSLLGLLILSQHIFNYNLGIDQLLFVDNPTAIATTHPGRMAFTTALNFTLIGVALSLLIKNRCYHLVQLLASFTTLTSLQVVIGYIYGIKPLLGLAYFIHTAFHTGLTFLLLSVGVLFANPSVGWLSLIVSNTASGITARVLMPAAVLVPFGLGGLSIWGERTGWFDNAFGLSLHVLGNMVVFMGLTQYCAGRLYRIDYKRQRAEQALRAAYEELEMRVEERTAQLREANLILAEEIEERKRAEAEEKASKDNFQAFIDHSTALIYVKDLQGRLLLVNRQFEKFIGLSREQIIGKTDSDIFPEELALIFQANDRQILTTGKAQTLEEVAKVGNKSTIFLSVKFPLYDAHGSIYAVSGISYDITERKAIEEKLKESEARSRAIAEEIKAFMEAVPVAVWIAHDPQCHKMTCNPAAYELMRRTPEDIMTATPKSGDYPFPFKIQKDGQDLPLTELPMQQAALTGQKIEADFEFVFDKNDVRFISGRAVPLRDERDNIRGVIGAFWDITELKQAEENLRQTEERFRRALLDAPLPTLLHTEEGEVLLVNQAWSEITGYSIEENPTLGAWLDKAYGDRKEQVQAQFCAKFPLKGRTDIGEYTITTRSGQTRLWDIHVSPLGHLSDGRKLVITMAFDITEHRQTEHERDQFFTLSLDMLGIAGVDGYFKQINPAWQRVLGYTEAEILSQPFLNFVHPDDRTRTSIEADTCATGAPSFRFENRYLCKYGSYKWLAWTSFTNPETGLIYTVARDVTERKRAEEALLEQANLLELVYEAILVRDANNVITFWNQGAEDLYGWTRSQAIGQVSHTLLQTVLAPSSPHFDEILYSIGRWEGELTHTRADGTQIIVESRQRLVRDNQGNIKGVLEVNRDITGRKLTEAQLQHNALHDALTRLPNRALLMERIRAVIERAKRKDNYHFALLFIDLDRFKYINDTLGHLVGDGLLVEIANRLLQCVRSTDTVARLGGDEFIILLDDLPEEKEAFKITERLLKQLKSPMMIQGQQVTTSGSIGIVFNSEQEQSGDDLLRNADLAMYSAKEQGKSRYAVFNPTMHERAHRLWELENHLRNAIELKQFVLYYQPILCLTTHRLVGFEALIRWRHPQKGLISPQEFIPMAEETGLIIPMGEWVLQEACQQLAHWQQIYPQVQGCFMSVNLSSRQLELSNLITIIDQILQQTGLPGSRLKLEITETLLMKNVEGAITLLSQLKERSIGVTIDDFGTGYSSLSYLCHLPVNTLKIDRTFVAKLDDRKENAQVIQAIIGLARQLTINVIAEGIETHHHLTQLQEFGCEYGQGYFFSKPLDSQQAAQLICAN